MSLAIVFSTLVTLFVSFCAGFLLLHFLKIPVPPDWNFALLFPLYAALGIACLVLILVSLSTVYLDFLVSCLVGFLLVAVFFLVVKKRTRRLSSAAKSLREIRFLLPILLFGFSFCRFVYLAIDLGWAPYVDSQTHGMVTGLVLYHKGLPSSYYPVGNMSFNPLRYPLGYHVFSAFVSMLTGLYPGESILVVGTVIVLLLPSLLYTTVYLFSESTKLSLLSFLLAYFLPGNSPALWRQSHDLLLGNLLVGTYPNILGNLVFLVLIILAVNFDGPRQCLGKKISLLYGLLVVTLGASYYPLLPFFFLFLLLRLFFHIIAEQPRNIQTYMTRIGLLVAAIVSFLFLSSSRFSFVRMFRIDSSSLHGVYMRYYLFSLDSTYSIYIVFILAAVPFALWFLLRKRLRNLGLLFFVLFIPLMVAHDEQIYSKLLWFIQPDRALILLTVCSYCVILGGLHTSIRWISNRWLGVLNRVKLRLRLNKRTTVQFHLKQLTIAFAFVLFIPSLLCHMTYSYPDRYQAVLPHGNDSDALRWLADNVDSNEVLLNDRTAMGLWVTSFEALKVVNDREILREILIFGSLEGTYLATRTFEANEILNEPWIHERNNEIISKYNISYIYLSENREEVVERGQGIWPFPWRNLTQEERIAAYLENPQLELAYRSGNAAILRVVTSQSSYGK